MTDNIPLHLRITGLTTTNENVDSCRAAVAKLAAAWAKIKQVDEIIKKAADIADCLGGDGTPPDELGIEVQVAVQKKASAFLYAERPLEVGVCAGMAAVTMLKPAPSSGGWTILDVYANALWSALAFQPVLGEEKRENLRREVFDRAQRRSLESAEKVRERDAVADPIDLIVTVAEDRSVTTNFKTAILSSVEALLRNATLDREEIDFLWWSQLNRSTLLDRPLANISEATRLVTAGIEASGQLRRLPANVHRDLVLRRADMDTELDLVELIAEIGADRTALGRGVHGATITSWPSIFPLLNAIVTGETECDGAKEKRTASTWGARALLEGALSRMMTTGLLTK